MTDQMEFDGLDSYHEILAWMKASGDTCALANEVIYTTPIMLIKTATGTAAANPGDWIIRKPDGTFDVERGPEIHYFEPLLCLGCLIEQHAGQRNQPNPAIVIANGASHCAEHIKFQDGPVLPGRTASGLILGNGS